MNTVHLKHTEHFTSTELTNCFRMQLFRNNLCFFCALVAVCVTLTNAQQIFYPALKVRQISVRANGRLNAVTSVALATPLPATRDAQGKRLAQRQMASGQRVGAQQLQQKVGGGGSQTFQQFTEQQVQRVATGGPQFQQFRGQQVQRVEGGQSPPIQQFTGQPVQRIGTGGPQFQHFQSQTLQQWGSPIQQFGAQQAQRIGGAGRLPPQFFQGQEPQRVGRQQVQQIGTPPFHQYRGQQVQSVPVGGVPFQQFQGQQLQQGGQPIQQFGRQEVQKTVVSGPQRSNFQVQQFQQSVGRPLPQVWEEQYDQPYGWQLNNWHVAK